MFKACQPLGSRLRFGIVCIVIWLLAVSLYHTHKQLPENLNHLGTEYRVSDGDVEFLYDLTYENRAGDITYDHHIFDTVFEVIEKAEKYILIDMFLFNSYGLQSESFHRSLSRELTERLIDKKRKKPNINIDFITDPINTVYGGSVSPELEALKTGGINVIVTDLEELRDSNFLYSALWRTFLRWFGNSDTGGLFKHPFSSGAGKVSARSYLRMLNFKANHRKILVADSDQGMISIISSANPHSGSSAHSNVAFLVRGEIWRSLYLTESAVAKLSGTSLSPVEVTAGTRIDRSGDVLVSILSENEIKEGLISEIRASQVADELKIAQFYLADREIIKELLDAAARDVDIEIVLDPNRDAFGYKKNGIPNRQSAGELVAKSDGAVKVRWYETHGEQFHVKMFIRKAGRRVTVIMGSANLTRRNLDNYNLELDIKIVTDIESTIVRAILDYFSRIWGNRDGSYSVDFQKYMEESFLKEVVYRIQEGAGLGTF